MKMFTNWKKKYESMCIDYKTELRLREEYEKDCIIAQRKAKAMSEEVDKQLKIIEEKDKKIEKMQRELDILYEYYDLNKEASQEIKTKIRTDDRIRKLELANEKLKVQNETLRTYLPLSLMNNYFTGYSNVMNNVSQRPMIKCNGNWMFV